MQKSGDRGRGPLTTPLHPSSAVLGGRVREAGEGGAIEHSSAPCPRGPSPRPGLRGAGGTTRTPAVEDEQGDPELAVTVYGADATALPEALDIRSVVIDELDEEIVAEEHVVIDPGTFAVFGNEIGSLEDPIDLCLSGRVKLFGAGNATLANGDFHGVFSRDGDGDLSLAGTDSDGGSSSGDIVYSGEAVSLTDKAGNPVAPPAIQYANGSGTRNASSQTSTRPQLL